MKLDEIQSEIFHCFTSNCIPVFLWHHVTIWYNSHFVLIQFEVN